TDCTTPKRSNTGSCTASLGSVFSSPGVTSRGQVYLAMHRSPWSARNAFTAWVNCFSLGPVVAACDTTVVHAALSAATIHTFVFMVSFTQFTQFGSCGVTP